MLKKVAIDIRDEIKWKTDNGMSAYLFAFSNKEKYSRIRLALYKN